MSSEDIQAWEYRWAHPPARSLIDGLVSILSKDESDRADRFHFSADRDSYILAHGLLRLALSRTCAIPPREWRFEPDKHGKPFIVWPAGESLRFSLTHSRGMVACASSARMDLGIDAEYVNKSLDLISIAKTVFSSFEYHALLSASEAERADRFFILWTLKEAYVKARGLGLSLPLDKFSFILGSAVSPEVRFEECMNDDSSHWQFENRRFETDHVLALAVHTGPAAANILLHSAREWLETVR